jgi:hypothetical protein
MKVFNLLLTIKGKVVLVVVVAREGGGGPILPSSFIVIENFY